MEEELKKLNAGLAAIEPVDGLVICDVCQRAILLYHLRTVGRRGGELDVCNVCRWHLYITRRISLEGVDEDGKHTSISFKSTEGPRCPLYYMGRVSPNAMDTQAAVAIKRLELEEENPARVTKNNRFKSSNYFALPDQILPPTEVSQGCSYVHLHSPPSQQEEVTDLSSKPHMKDPLATKSCAPDNEIKLSPAAKLQSPIKAAKQAPPQVPVKPHESPVKVMPGLSEHPAGTKRPREELHVDTTIDRPTPVIPSLIEFFSSFEAKYKVAGEEAPVRTLVHVGLDDDPVVPLTRGAFSIPSLNCHVIKGRVTRCISVDVVPSAMTDPEVYISVLGQHLRFQMDIWRCTYSNGCLGEPQLVHQLNVGKTEPLGCSWVPLPLKDRGRLGVCTLLRSRNLSTMAPPSSTEGAKIINPMLIGLCCLEKPAKKIEWWRGATTVDEAKLFVAMEDGSLEIYRPTKVDSKLHLISHHRIVSGHVDRVPISTCRTGSGSLCAWGNDQTLFSHVAYDTRSVAMPHNIWSILCYTGGTIVGLSNGNIYHVSHGGERELITSLPSEVCGLSQVGPHQVMAISSSGAVSVLDTSRCPPVCHSRLSVRTVKATGSEPPTISISQQLHSARSHSDVTMGSSNSTQPIGVLFTGGSIIVMACNTTH